MPSEHTAPTDILVAAIADRVVERVLEHLGDREPPQVDGLIGLQALCRRLDASPATVTRMVREGMPTMRLGGPGGERRWHWQRVLEWLEGAGQ